MSKDPNPTAGAPGAADLAEVESSLGQALAVIHRILPRLEEPGTDVQAAFKRLAGCIESARVAHERLAAATRVAALAARSHAGVPGETVAAIAAAVATVLGQSFRIVSVSRVPAPVPHLNVWALEGRTQIFQSHKVR